MKKKVFDIISSIFLGLGVIFIISPVVLYWWLHGDYQRYLWIINGPPPYTYLGSWGYQLLLSVKLIILGIILICGSIIIRKKLINKDN